MEAVNLQNGTLDFCLAIIFAVMAAHEYEINPWFGWFIEEIQPQRPFNDLCCR